jgi:hypothetical protein
MCRSQTEHADVEYAESGAASTLCQDHRGLVGEAGYTVPAARKDDAHAADFRVLGISSVCGRIRGGFGYHRVCCCNEHERSLS